MNSKARNVLRTSDHESAKPEWASIGERLVAVRGSRTQPEMADALGVSKTTYGRLERGVREIGADSLQRLAHAGWNIGWLLTGQGAQQLGDAAHVSDDHADYQSHVLRVDLLTMAVELIDSELARAGRTLPPDKRALAYSLIYEELLEPGDELPTAKILKLVLKAV